MIQPTPPRTDRLLGAAIRLADNVAQRHGHRVGVIQTDLLGHALENPAPDATGIPRLTYHFTGRHDGWTVGLIRVVAAPATDPEPQPAFTTTRDT